ncbi:MAG: AzlD domain-containing protein [Actinomycetota bacterium]
MSALLVFLVAGLGTYALRASMVVAGVDGRLDARWTARLGLIAPVMLTVIVVSSIAVEGRSVVAPGLAELAAVGVAAWSVRRTGVLFAAFATGFPVYWLFGVVT